MKIVDEELESITVAIEDMETGVFCREDGSMWMRVYLADAQAECTACCDIESQTLQSLDSRERVTPLRAALHVYGPKEVT